MGKLTKREYKEISQIPYYNNPKINVEFELDFNDEVIKVGDPIKIKNKQNTFRFRCLAHNEQIDSTWIDCMDITTGEWRSFRVDDLKGPAKKKSRRTKKNA